MWRRCRRRCCRRETGYLLNGEKRQATNAPIAGSDSDRGIGSPALKPRDITLFLVERSGTRSLRRSCPPGRPAGTR